MQTAVPTTPTLVVRTLVENHKLAVKDAEAAVDKCKDVISEAARHGSFVNYVIDDVLDAIDHECTDACDPEGENESDSENEVD